MTTDYELIFRHRGASYHEAMQRFPHVRSKEFENLFDRVPLKYNEAIVDCPSLGGYLSENVSQATNVTSFDFCPLNDSVQGVSNYELPFEGCIDRVVCLASSHHINDMDTFTRSVYRCLKRGGFFHLADVDSRNSVRYFLDDFVGEWTSTGHNGIWRDFLVLSRELEENVGLRVHGLSDIECPWVFCSLEQMLEFCRLLFGLDLNPSDSQIINALEKHVGIVYSADRVEVRWKLSYIDFYKP